MSSPVAAAFGEQRFRFLLHLFPKYLRTWRLFEDDTFKSLLEDVVCRDNEEEKVNIVSFSLKWRERKFEDFYLFFCFLIFMFCVEYHAFYYMAALNSDLPR